MAFAGTGRAGGVRRIFPRESRHTAALPPSPREVQQKNKIQNGGRGDSEINGTSRWEDVGFFAVELLVVAEDQIFCSHSILAWGQDPQLQAAWNRVAGLAA